MSKHVYFIRALTFLVVVSFTWITTSQAQLSPSIHFEEHYNHMIHNVTWSKSAQKLIVTHWGTNVEIIDIDDQSNSVNVTHNEITHFNNLTYSADLNQGENTILTASRDGTARTWDTESGEELLVLDHGVAFVREALWIYDDNQIVTWTKSDATVSIWDSSTGELLKQFSHPQLAGISISESSSQIATWSRDGIVAIWNTDTGEKIIDFTNDGRVWQVEWLKQDSEILTTSEDGYIRIRNVSSGVLLREFVYSNGIRDAIINQNETYIIAFSQATGILYNISSTSPILEHEHLLNAIWATDKRDGIYWFEDKAIVYYDLASETETRFDASEAVSHIVPLNDKHTLISLSLGGLLEVWDTSTSNVIMTIETGVHQPIGISLSPDQSNLAIWSTDTLEVWNLAQ